MPIDFRSFSTTGVGAGIGDNLRGWNLGVPTWPNWAKFCLFVPMIPGILLLALSITVFIASLAALFVLTAPVFMLLNRLLNVRNSGRDYRSPGSKRVEAVIRDA